MMQCLLQVFRQWL